jgi:hypothetical protein
LESKSKTKAAKGWNASDLQSILERIEKRINENRRIIKEMLGEVDEREAD